MANLSLIEAEQLINGHGFYSPDEAARIARIPPRMVYAWRRQEIIVPSIKWEDEEGNEELGYGFNSVVYLRLLRMLRDNDISLERSVQAVYDLTNRFGPPGPRWEEARIFVEGRHAYVFAKDEWRTTVLTMGNQRLFEELFGEEFIQLRKRADALLVPKRYQPYVELDPKVRNGLPVILGTSIPTHVIHSLILQGQSYDNIIYNYPSLTMAQVKGGDGYETFLDAEALAA